MAASPRHPARSQQRQKKTGKQEKVKSGVNECGFIRPISTFGALSIAGFLSILILSGCTDNLRSAVVEPEGKLEILDISPGFSPKDLPESWVIEGPADTAKTQITVLMKEGVKALKITNSSDNFIVARRTKALMLATPYLAWAWNMAPHGSGDHPVRVVVGFKGGIQGNGHSLFRPLSKLGSTLPDHNRVLTVNWSETALQRGHEFTRSHPT